MPRYTSELTNHFNHNSQRWEYRIYIGDLVTGIPFCHAQVPPIGVVLAIDKEVEWCTVQWNSGSPPSPYRTQYRQLILVEDIDEYNTLKEEHRRVIINGLLLW